MGIIGFVVKKPPPTPEPIITNYLDLTDFTEVDQ